MSIYATRNFQKILKNDEENFNLFFDAIEEYFKNKDEYKIQTIYSYARHKLDDENYFKNHYKSKRWNTIIIDEGQDFPLRVLEWLKHQADRIICFIDDGQSSAEPNSGYPDFVEEVTELLGADLPYDLEQNHRNTQAIIDLAKEFSYKKEDSPSITGQGEKPYWHRVSRENEQTLLERIFKENPNKTIGIFCPKKPKERFHDNFIQEHNIQIYESYDYSTRTPATPLKFNPNMRIAMSYGVIKGLEFDVVVLLSPNRVFKSNGELSGYRQQIMIYATITRAKEKLYFLADDYSNKKYFDFNDFYNNHKNLFQEW